MSIPGRAFSRSAMRGSSMGSNAITDQNQGGGSKKAGFPYTVGRIYGVSLIHKMSQPLSAWAITPIGSRNVRQSRPISVRPSPNVYNYH